MRVSFTLGPTSGSNLIGMVQRGNIIPRVPQLNELNQPNTAWRFRRGYEDPCKNCPNNPENNPFATGFCHCALPSLRNPMF